MILLYINSINMLHYRHNIHTILTSNLFNSIIFYSNNFKTFIRLFNLDIEYKFTIKKKKIKFLQTK